MPLWLLVFSTKNIIHPINIYISSPCWFDHSTSEWIRASVIQFQGLVQCSNISLLNNTSVTNHNIHNKLTTSPYSSNNNTIARTGKVESILIPNDIRYNGEINTKAIRESYGWAGGREGER